LWMMAAINWPVAIISIYIVSKLLGTSAYKKPQPDADNPEYPVGSESIPTASVYVADTQADTRANAIADTNVIERGD
jgi:hypothetical protein